MVSKTTMRLASVVLVGALLPFLIRAETVTKVVYRITPRNYTGVTDFDTGDSAGDAFFGLYELQAPALCVNGTQSGASGLLCRNDPILQIPGFNVYEQFEVEMDARMGDYAECNPSSEPPHNFECTHFHRSEACWYNDPEHPQWKTEFADVCPQSECTCDVIESKAVGSELVASVFGRSTKTNKTYPAVCSAAGFQQFMGYAPRGFPAALPETTSEADCCSKCSALGRGCQGYGYTYATSKCEVFRDIFTGKPDNGSSFGYLEGGTNLTRKLERQGGILAMNLNGTWYSTQAAGECQPGQEIGDGCYWRLKNLTSNVNASCVNGNIVNAAVAQNPDCWKACPQPNNMSSICWIQCLFDTVAGDPDTNKPAMPKELIVKAFEQSFDSSSPNGCPQVPPCPSPCLPPHEPAEAMFTAGSKRG